MRSLGWYNAMKHAALIALVGAVAVATGGCAATANSATRSAGLVDSELVRNHPPNANTLYGMARLLRSQEKNDQAEFVLLSLLRDYPTFSPTYNDLAEIRMSQNRFDEAIEYLDKGIAVAPNDAVLLNNAGVCAMLRRDYASALVYFQRASAIEPYRARYRANVALAMGLNGEHEGSRAMYGQIVSSEDADFNANLIRELTKPRAVKEVAYQVPVETPDQDATLEVPETTSAVQAVELEAPLVAEAEAAPTAPAVIDESKSAEVAQPEASFANFEAAAVEPVVPAALVEASRSEAVRPVESLTNSDVEALEVNILNVERRSEVAGPEERVEPEESTIGFEVEAVEAEPGHIEQTVEASDDGESGAELGFGAEVVEVEPEPQAVEADGAHLALAIEDGEPAVGDVSALVLEVVEPEETQPAPEETVQEREWVEGEFLLEETAPEDHVVPNPLVEAAAAEALPASMLDEFVVAAEAAELDDSAAGDGQAMKVTEAEVLEQLEDNPTGEIIEVMKLDESTD